MRNSRMAWIIAGILVAVAVFGLAGRTFAQTPVPSDDAVNAIAKQLYCPVCENIPLDVCGTQACVQWRELIRQKLAAGWSEQQIKDYFVQQYGDRVLGQPPLRGLNLLVYIVPVVAFLAGGVILFRVLRGMRAPAPAAPVAPLDSPTPSNDPYANRLEEELKKRK